MGSAGAAGTAGATRRWQGQGAARGLDARSWDRGRRSAPGREQKRREGLFFFNTVDSTWGGDVEA